MPVGTVDSRLVLSDLPKEVMALAHQNRLRLDLALWPYLAVAEAAWRDRGSLSLYDASYVGRCDVRTPAGPA